MIRDVQNNRELAPIRHVGFPKSQRGIRRNFPFIVLRLALITWTRGSYERSRNKLLGRLFHLSYCDFVSMRLELSEISVFNNLEVPVIWVGRSAGIGVSTGAARMDRPFGRSITNLRFPP